MVVYTEAGTTFQVLWANKPHLIPSGAQEPPIQLVGIRLAGGVLQVAVQQAPTLVWDAAEKWLCGDEAERWSRKGFAARPALKANRRRQAVPRR